MCRHGITEETRGAREESSLTLEELLERTEAERDKLQVQRNELEKRVMFLEDELEFMNSQFALLRKNNDCGLFLKLPWDKSNADDKSRRLSGGSLDSVSTCASTSLTSDRPLLSGRVVPSQHKKAEALSLPRVEASLCEFTMEKLKGAFLANDTARACSIVQQMVTSQQQVVSTRRLPTLSLGASQHEEEEYDQMSSEKIAFSFSCELNWALLKSSDARHNSSDARHRTSDWQKPNLPAISKMPVQQELMLGETRPLVNSDYAALSRRVRQWVLLEEALQPQPLGQCSVGNFPKSMYSVTEFALRFRRHRPQQNLGKQRTACAFHLRSTLISATSPL